jgi:acyl-phosphate glycerol 3-phosphate acyltransferase
MEALAIIIGYLLGSIPFAYIAGRVIKGVDIRQVGGGNVGATNVMREVGTVAGFGVLIADIAKGAIAVLIGCHQLIQENGGSLCIIEPNPELFDILETLNIDRVINIYVSEEYLPS